MKKIILLAFICYFFFEFTAITKAQETPRVTPANQNLKANEQQSCSPVTLIKELSQTVIFLYEDKTPPGSDKLVPGRILGTAFIIGIPSAQGSQQFIPFVVTAKHVIAKQTKILGRYSPKRGDQPLYARYDLEELHKTDDIWEHPNEGVDIVVMRSPAFEEAKMKVFPIANIASEQTFSSENISPADRVVIPCLLQDYPGTSQNYPIIREGSIALISEEPVEFSWELRDKLINTRQKIIFINSTFNEGFSGAPVFLWPGPRGGKVLLLGIVHGFNPVYRKVIDAEKESVILKKPAREPDNIIKVYLPERAVPVLSVENSATGIVFPSWQILEIIESDAVKKKVQDVSQMCR